MSPPFRPSYNRFSSFPENAVASSSCAQLTPTSEKRRTWNGGQRGPHSPTVLQKREHRQSGLSGLLNADRSLPSLSGLQTPPRSPSLAQVLEDEEEDAQARTDPAEISLNERDERERPQDSDSFGTAALYLRRRRRASGAEIFGLTTSRSVPILRNSPATSPRSSLSSSRYTSLSGSRHPFSLSALQNALHSALSARRYACAHLLALRFEEDAEDEGYWENVRSVASLLTSTFEDAASRLHAAIGETERQAQQDSEITPESSPRNSLALASNVSIPTDIGSGDGERTLGEKAILASRLSSLMDSSFTLQPSSSCFAPAPSLIARFSSHVEGVSSSMDDAREHLAECVKQLQAFMSRNPFSDAAAGDASSEQALLETYDRFRHELGVLLRECERGKSVLLDVVEARCRLQRGPEAEADEIEGQVSLSSGRVRTHPTSGSSKDSYDNADLEPLTPADGSPLISTMPEVEDSDETHVDGDDASHHLLLSTAAQHLPPAGLEQIFEAEVADPASNFTRERSKLSREERIRLMRTKRESMTGRGLAALLETDEEQSDQKPARSSWGPGTDVVAELKDVIWKVGERRRRMTADMSTVQASILPAPSPSSERADVYDTDLCTM